MDIKIRRAAEDEFLEVHKFVSRCKPLERYPEHYYKILLRYFGSCCFIAEHRHKIVGLITGLVSHTQKNTYFMWQIGVDPALRRENIGKLLLQKTEQYIKKIGCTRIELTIDPENIPSKNFFEKNGYQNISSKEGETIMVNGFTAVKDYYKPHRHFLLLEKQL